MLFWVWICLWGSALNSVRGLEIFDLTWDFDNKTIYWGVNQPLQFTKKVGKINDSGYWVAFNEFCTAEHGGTHLDAPYHYYKEGWKVGDIPKERLIAHGAFIKITTPKQNLTVSHLENWEETNGKFRENTVLLISFDWSKRWPNRSSYYDADYVERKMYFPGLSDKAAQWIADNGKIIGVGLDTPSVDPGLGVAFMAHRTLAPKNIYNLENVKLLDDLPSTGFSLLVMPMKLKYGTGAPVRLMAIKPELIF